MESRETRRTHQRKFTLGRREKRRLVQLGICLLTFLTVFLFHHGKQAGSFWNGLGDALQSDTNFSAVISRLEQAYRSERPWGETVVALSRQVFHFSTKQNETDRCGGLLYAKEKAELTDSEGAMLAYQATEPTVGISISTIAESETPQPEETEEPEWIPASYTGPELPENTSMDWYNLHLEKIVSPVKATSTSSFGWRENPIEGGQQFHHGVDLGVPLGTDVLAFAAGTVEYIGENDIYGLYLQIDHGNGIKSFYAHCSELCVRQGRIVEAGEKVAESGETGNATGPHLHLELKRNGVYLNPLQYLNMGEQV